MAGASVYRGADGVWRARVIFPTDPATGRRARKVKAFPQASSAEEARELAAAYAEGASGASVAGALARYAGEVAEKGAPGRTPKANTAHDYLGYARRLGEAFPAVPVCEVTPAMVSSVESRLLSRGLSGSTVNGYHQFMSGAFAWMVRQGWIASNPAADAIHPTAARPDASGKALGEGELRRLLAAAREGRDLSGRPSREDVARVAVELIAVTGMRLGEALALRVRDFRPSVPDVYVCGTVCERGGVTRQPTAKRGEDRRVAVPESVVPALSSLAAGRALDDALLSPDGATMRSEPVRRALRELCDEAGVRRVTPHALRHTHATLALQRGFTMLDVQARLGHADVKTTLAVYGHTTPARDRSIADSFGA